MWNDSLPTHSFVYCYGYHITPIIPYLKVTAHTNHEHSKNDVVNEIEAYDYIKRTGFGVLPDEIYIIPDTVGN